MEIAMSLPGIIWQVQISWSLFMKRAECFKLIFIVEINLAENAEKHAAGSHPGWEPTALEGLTMSLSVINEKRIKVVINGGALNPKGLAEKVQAMASDDQKVKTAIANVSVG
jgi:hypothetical protein